MTNLNLLKKRRENKDTNLTSQQKNHEFYSKHPIYYFRQSYETIKRYQKLYFFFYNLLLKNKQLIANKMDEILIICVVINKKIVKENTIETQ